MTAESEFKKRYSNIIKNDKLLVNKESTSFRDILGERDISTIVNIIKWFYPNHSISEHSNGKFRLESKVKLLDIGCGDKFMEKPCKKRGIDYTGIDFEECDLEQDKIPYPDDTFDIVLNYSVIEHLYSPSNFLRESYRVLKKGGLLAVITPNWKLDMRNFYDDPTHVRPYTKTGLEQVLRIAGFTDLRVLPALRCKPRIMYTNKYAISIGNLIPFRYTEKMKWVPQIFKGKCRAILGIGIKKD